MEEGPLGSSREVPRARFYGHYRGVAEEHDEELVRKYSKILDATIILVSLVRCSDARVLI